jgi:hypothetical protein
MTSNISRRLPRIILVLLAAAMTWAATVAADRTAPEQAAAKPAARHSITYKLSDGSEQWDPEIRQRIVDAMEAAVALYNEHGEFNKLITANYSPGTPTADANYNGWINFGGQINKRVALHEISHTLGVGTHRSWRGLLQDGKWTGEYAIAQLREFDGPDAELRGDRQHFWPYGLNYDREGGDLNVVRHVKMVEALRRDMGISNE